VGMVRTVDWAKVLIHHLAELGGPETVINAGAEAMCRCPLACESHPDSMRR
jgi:hypothetical protein